MRALLILALLLFGAVAAHAQRPARQGEPPRPALARGADTTDARSYYEHGVQLLKRRPAQAAAAFHWSARLDPGPPAPYYAHYVALLLTDSRALNRFVAGRADESPLRAAVDSLRAIVWSRDPFHFGDLDVHLLEKYLASQQAQAAMPSQNIMPPALRFPGDPGVGRPSMPHSVGVAYSPLILAWFALAVRDFAGAREYLNASERVGEAWRLRWRRAHVAVAADSLGEAERELRRALEELREQNHPEAGMIAARHALGLGIILQRVGAPEEARQAYETALLLNPSLSAARERLSLLHLVGGDSAAARAEAEAVVELRPDDAAMRWQLAVLTFRMGDDAASLAELRHAIRLEPWFAAPYFLLGVVLDRSGSHHDALAAYTRYLERAPAHQPQRATAQARVEALRTVLGEP